MTTNRANIICLLEILREYSDANHVLRMQDIIAKMKVMYDIEVDRRTVYGAIDLLKRLGHDISCYSDNGVGYYLADRLLEPSEVRLLTDAVYAYQAISAPQTEKLVEKLQKLLNAYDRKVYKNMTVVKNDKKTTNYEVFLNVEILDEAIQKKKKVQFTYLAYDFDKSLKPRREKKYTVNPYQLICTNEHYYLACKMAPESRVSFYRIDLMRDISVSEFNIEAPLNERELMIAGSKTMYAWYGEPEIITMRCKNYVLGDVIDKFGRGITIKKENDETFLATIKIAPHGVQFWALQYLPHIEVLSPDWLRDEIIESLKSNPYCEVKS